MTQFKDIEQYLPQRVFLVQGHEGIYDTLLSSAIISDPTVYSFSTPRLTIDHARSIVSFIFSGTGQIRTCLVYFTIFSPEAAQVLLKALEEPDELTHVLFVTPFPYLVPQTIRSRVMIVPMKEEGRSMISLSTRDQAFSYIKKEFDAEVDDAATRRAKAVLFLDALEEYAKETPSAAHAVYEAKHMLFNANMPAKYVLEYAVSIAMR